MKLLRNLAAAVLILALHLGLLVLMAGLSPPTAKPSDRHAATLLAVALPTKVVVLLAPLPPQPTPADPRRHTSADKIARATGVPRSSSTVTLLLPDANTATAAAAQPTATVPAFGDPKPSAALNIGPQSLQSAARETDKNSVRRLALQSGNMHDFDGEKAHPIAWLAAESSEPLCPPAIQLRESVGDHGYRLTPDRSSDCARERKARVRAKAFGSYQ